MFFPSQELLHIILNIEEMGEKYARSQREKEGSTATSIEQTEIISIPDVIWNPVVRYQSIKEINKILIICHIQIYSELDYQKM